MSKNITKKGNRRKEVISGKKNILTVVPVSKELRDRIAMSGK